MRFQEIQPVEQLKPYIKCFWMLASDEHTNISECLLPGGTMEIVFNLGEAVWRSAKENMTKGSFRSQLSDSCFSTDPPIELLGQVTRPIPIRASGSYSLLGIRFFPHTAACFIDEPISDFNNQIIDCRMVIGNSIGSLHQRLLNTAGVKERIAVVEAWLISSLSLRENRAGQIGLLGQVLQDLSSGDSSLILDRIVARYNISPRYLQRLFLQHVGISPKTYSQVSRFKQSLQLIEACKGPLTAIAYECGYADQSHFIREFKAFTGLTPTAYLRKRRPADYPVGMVT